MRRAHEMMRQTVAIRKHHMIGLAAACGNVKGLKKTWMDFKNNGRKKIALHSPVVEIRYSFFTDIDSGIGCIYPNKATV